MTPWIDVRRRGLRRSADRDDPAERQKQAQHEVNRAEPRGSARAAVTGYLSGTGQGLADGYQYLSAPCEREER